MISIVHNSFCKLVNLIKKLCKTSGGFTALCTVYENNIVHLFQSYQILLSGKLIIIYCSYQVITL